MSKKRVHEIAKELKGHGIELDNKEVVTELAGLGYDVKSHSSSLDDDQATAAVQKILDKRKPKQAAPPVAAKGFVVRRRVGPPAGASNTEAQDSYAQSNDQGYDNPDQAYEQPAQAEPQVEAPQAHAVESAPAAVEQASQAKAPEVPAVTAAPITEAVAAPAAPVVT
ncbi:translation initiation factor IF-2 N-terminal domain-containing protein, partial [Corallococcus sp. CA053C]|uniref:translation initiation factor IF-2 N-terminal domain-containing protein n=1 Tax=Corallococcus sp. CA053C TaxID=2316732 RepID=UPI001F3F1814